MDLDFNNFQPDEPFAFKEKVLIVSHWYQDFTSASIQFHHISTVVAFKTTLCDTVVLSITDVSSCS